MDNEFTIFGLGPGEYSIQLTDANGQGKFADLTLLDDEVPFFPCTAPLDIVILNDVSGSVDAIEYSESQTFFVDFLRSANIGQGDDESQASIIEWSNNREQRVMIPITGDISELESYAGMSRAFSSGTVIHPAMEFGVDYIETNGREEVCLLYTSPSPRDATLSRMPSSA